MNTHTMAHMLKQGDVITLCGRVETVTRVETSGDRIHVYVPDDPNDPYLLNCDEIVPIHAI